MMFLAMLLLLHAGSIAAQTSPPGIPDSDLTERVRATLVTLRVLSVDRDELRVRVRDGAVTLQGCVETKAEKDEVDLRVKLIPGVKSLHNALTIGCPRKS